MITAFCVVAFLVFSFVGVFWNSSTTANTFTKYFFFLMSLWALLCVLMRLGFTFSG